MSQFVLTPIEGALLIVLVECVFPPLNTHILQIAEEVGYVCSVLLTFLLCHRP